MDNTSRVYYIASLFWLGGIKFLLLPFFHNATRIISNTAVVFENIFTMYDDYKITHTFLQPGSLATVMKVMEEKKIQCLNVEHMMCGGSFVYASLRKSFAKSFPNAVMGIAYGTTEVHHLTLLIHDKNAKETLSVGVLRENIQMKIVNEDDIPLGFNQIGDICAKPYKNVFCVR